MRRVRVMHKNRETAKKADSRFLCLQFYYQLLYGGKSMNSETALVAARYCIKEWEEQIRDCQNRLAGMSVADWYAGNGITKPNYYYRLRRVRSA